MNEKQAMVFLERETKRWAHVIAHKDHVRVEFKPALHRGAAGTCYPSLNLIEYSRKSLFANLDNKQGLTDITIHEVIHFKFPGHGNDFQTEYVKWTGHPLEEARHVSTLHSARRFSVKKRGDGKTLEGKWRVEYVRYDREPCLTSPTGYGIHCVTVKEKPMTKTEAMKIFRMASGKDYPAWLYQYVSSAVTHGWKQVEYHESVNAGQRVKMAMNPLGRVVG